MSWWWRWWLWWMRMTQIAYTYCTLYSTHTKNMVYSIVLCPMIGTSFNNHRKRKHSRRNTKHGARGGVYATAQTHMHINIESSPLLLCCFLFVLFFSRIPNHIRGTRTFRISIRRKASACFIKWRCVEQPPWRTRTYASALMRRARRSPIVRTCPLR